MAENVWLSPAKIARLHKFLDEVERRIAKQEEEIAALHAFITEEGPVVEQLRARLRQAERALERIIDLAHSNPLIVETARSALRSSGP